MTRKNRLQAQIAEYKKRRDKIRSEYDRWNAEPEYSQRVTQINKKIKSWRRSIRVLEDREQKIRELNNLICQFMDIKTLRHSASDKRRHMADAKKLFCTLALERRMGNNTLAEFLGCAASLPYLIRRRFRRSLKTNAKNRELWLRFQTFLKDHND